MSDTSSIESFWGQARLQHPELPQEPAQAWAFGATADMADELLVLVLAGIKTATASSLWDYEAEGEALPHAGQLNIVLDGQGVPGAIVETTIVDIVPFNEVSAEHAFAEGEGDRSLDYWRTEHERFWRTYGVVPPKAEPTMGESAEAMPSGFVEDMPVVCERFRLLYP